MTVTVPDTKPSRPAQDGAAALAQAGGAAARRHLVTQPPLATHGRSIDVDDVRRQAPSDGLLVFLASLLIMTLVT